MKAAFEGPEGGLTAESRGPGGFGVDRAGPERVGVRGPARDRDAGAPGRKASGGLSAVGRLRVACSLRRGRWAGGGVGAPHLGRVVA